MLSERKCPECGTVIPTAAAGGLCPKCALAAGLGVVIHYLGDYELQEEIARGGMGVVYKARQISLNRAVAVKLVLAGQLAGQEAIQRFRKEAEAAASLQHPNIVAIHEVGEHEGRQYFSMDYVKGKNLAELVREKPLPAARAARYVETIAKAVQYAHERGVLHRDLKPANVLIDSADQPRVTDFGLAKKLNLDSELTQTGQILGSPSFMPPEQAAGKRGAMGPHSDVYALGAILYNLLAGRPPFLAESADEALQLVLTTDSVPLRSLNPSIPRDLETICLKCMEKEPQRRYESAQVLAEELGRFLNGEPIHARPISRVEKVWRWCQRQPKMAALTTAVVALILTISIASPMATLRINRERQRAKQSANKEAQLRRQAELQELTARQKAYASDINRVQQAALKHLDRARELLDRNRPQLGQTELRGWEWRYLWQRVQSDALFTLRKNSNAIGSLAISHDGRWLAIGEHSGSGTNEVWVWDLQARQVIAEIASSGGKMVVAFSPRESLLAFTGIWNRRCMVRLWDVATRQTVAELPVKENPENLAFSADGQSLLTVTTTPRLSGSRLDATADYRLTLWRFSDGAMVRAYPTDWFTNSASISAPLRSSTSFLVTRDLNVAAHRMPGRRIRVVDLTSGMARWTADAAGETVAFSPDGKTLAFAGGDTEAAIRLWDVASGREIGRLEGHRYPVTALIFFADGRRLASASRDLTIRLWDTASLRSLGAFRGHQREVTQLELLPDNTMLLGGSRDGSVHVWDTRTAQSDYTPAILPAKPYAWGFAADGNSILTLDKQGNVAKWDGTDFQKKESVLSIGTNFVRRVRISRDGRLLAVLSADSTIQVWDLGRQERHVLLRQIEALPRAAYPWDFMGPEPSLVIARPINRSLQEWDMATWRETRSWRGATNWWTGACSPDGRWCLTIGTRGQCVIREMDTGRERSRMLDMKEICGIAFSPDGRRVAMASKIGFVKLWDTHTLQEIVTFRSLLPSIRSVAWSPDGKRLVTGSEGKEALTLWDVESHEELLTLEGEGSKFDSIAFSPDGNVLGAMNSQGELHLWRAPSWAEINAAEQTQSKAQ